jgi:Protein of unknown function (DUF2752)
MQIARRPLAPGETDYELIWLSVSLGGLALAASWFALRLPWPVCLFHTITGHPCATCGATRSAIAFFHGDLFHAWKWNPLAFLAYCSLSIFDVYAFFTLIMRTPRLRIVQLGDHEKKFLRIAIIAVFAVNWIYLLIASPVA